MGLIKTVLFDVDGVLVDSKDANFAWLSSVITEFGYPKPKKEDYEAAFGMDRHDTLKALTKENSEARIRQLAALARSKNDSFPLEMLKVRAGEVEVLEKLSKAYKLGIVTSSSARSVRRLFAIADIRKLFAAVVTRDDYGEPKPSPEPLLVALKKLGISPENAVYIGDTSIDVIAGHAAGIKVISYSEGGLEGAEANVSTFEEIPHALEKLDGN